MVEGTVAELLASEVAELLCWNVLYTFMAVRISLEAIKRARKYIDVYILLRVVVVVCSCVCVCVAGLLRGARAEGNRP